MARPNSIELPDCEPIPILFEDRTVLAVDKPPGWMLAPDSWLRTQRNLQAAITSSILAGDFWARSRGLKFLRHVHRLDADTSGVLLLAKSPGVVNAISALFEGRKMEKVYLAIVCGKPAQPEWTCRLALAPDERRVGRMRVDSRNGRTAETDFKLIQSRGKFSLVEAKPFTGRTHQIRVHLAESGVPVVGDEIYGKPLTPSFSPSDGKRVAEGRVRGASLGLRSVRLAFVNPFTQRRVEIEAPTVGFLRKFGFG